MQLRDEKGAMQVSLQLSQREATEARGLWETEIRSRASISLRVSPPLPRSSSSESHLLKHQKEFFLFLVFLASFLPLYFTYVCTL